MKRRDLEKRLRQLGWYFLRHGGNHDVWTNGIEREEVPRHNEVNELLARKILKHAQKANEQNQS
ncbi:MAG: type II toxin-antitoxin system HicA family toxin [Proteobacteria bacterium]|nr:type II toxin-antitoxin system HicA family toxin [Pseudomonadota bacterium]